VTQQNITNKKGRTKAQCRNVVSFHSTHHDCIEDLKSEKYGCCLCDLILMISNNNKYAPNDDLPIYFDKSFLVIIPVVPGTVSFQKHTPWSNVWLHVSLKLGTPKFQRHSQDSKLLAIPTRWREVRSFVWVILSFRRTHKKPPNNKIIKNKYRSNLIPVLY
jgi:hypothetical protein